MGLRAVPKLCSGHHDKFIHQSSDEESKFGETKKVRIREITTQSKRLHCKGGLHTSARKNK